MAPADIATGSSRHTSRRKHRRRDDDEPRYWRTYAYRHGQYIEVELRGSRNRLTRRQLGTLDSLRLRRRGAKVLVRFDRATTPGMLHAVRHVIVHRSVEEKEPRVSTRTYEASGGPSLLLRVAGEGQLRVEAQKDGFVLVWPTALSLPAFLDAVRPLVGGAEGRAMALIGGRPTELSLKDAWLASEDAGHPPRLLRLDFEDRSLIWSDDYADERRAGHAEAPSDESLHEASFAATRFDETLVRRLLASTAAFDVESLVERAAPELQSYR
jgi:ribosomal protein L30/L7E